MKIWIPTERRATSKICKNYDFFSLNILIISLLYRIRMMTPPKIKTTHTMKCSQKIRISPKLGKTPIMKVTPEMKKTLKRKMTQKLRKHCATFCREMRGVVVDGNKTIFSSFYEQGWWCCSTCVSCLVAGSLPGSCRIFCTQMFGIFSPEYHSLSPGAPHT